MARGKILLVDDEAEVREFLKDYFEDRDFDVSVACNGEEGLEEFRKQAFDLVVCDMLMPKMIGLEFLKRAKEIKPEQKIILMTGVKEDSMVEKAKALGCHLYIFKPVRLKEVEARVLECFPNS